MKDKDYTPQLIYKLLTIIITTWSPMETIEQQLEMSSLDISETEDFTVLKNDYYCNKCDVKYNIRSEFTEHMKFGAEHALTCHLCNITYDNRQLYNTHISEVHKHKCALCNINFSNAQRFKRHVINNHQNNTTQMPLKPTRVMRKRSVGPDIYSIKLRKRSANSDINSKVRTRKRITSSNINTKTNSNDTNKQKRRGPGRAKKETVTKDVVTETTNCLIKPFKCVFCASSFNTSKLLSFHIVHKHNNIKCEICDLLCESRNELDIHIQKVHEYINITCELCEKSFTKQNNYELHFNGYCKF